MSNRGRRPRLDVFVLGLELAAARDAGTTWKLLARDYPALSIRQLQRVERAARTTLEIKFCRIAERSPRPRDVR